MWVGKALERLIDGWNIIYLLVILFFIFDYLIIGFTQFVIIFYYVLRKEYQSLEILKDIMCAWNFIFTMKMHN